jgi:hypothetical protein
MSAVQWDHRSELRQSGPAPTWIRLAWLADASAATLSALVVETWSENTVGLSESAAATSIASTVADTGRSAEALPLPASPVTLSGDDDDEVTGTTCTRSPPWTGFFVLCIYTAVVLVIGGILLVRRDA